MSRTFRLTRRAAASLTDMARWTIQTFGARQAEIYETELIARCEALTRGEVASRSCSVLVDGAADLRFCRAEEHFLIFVEQEDAVAIVDVLHVRIDLPRHIASLTEQGRGGC